MVIRASAAAEIRALVDSLNDGAEIRREAAMARLAIIGSRAVDRLLTAVDSQPDRTAQVAILRVLESIGDPRALPAARTALTREGDVALAAIGVLRALLDSSRGTESFDLLVAAVLDVGAERRIRLAALDALQNLSDSVRGPVADVLARDPDPLLRDRIRSGDHESAAADALWTDMLSGRLPDDPRPIRSLLAARAATTSLNSLQKLVDAVRNVENAARDTAVQHQWRAVRGALHQALAIRGSRVALYDLRETLEHTSDRLPVSFVAALQVVGDSSLLEPIAAALSRASGDESPWRGQLATAFRIIAQREKVTRRHSTFRKIAARWPHLAAELGGAASHPRRHS